MPDGSETPVRVLASIEEVDAAAWDACAGSADPFLRHAFLAALEQTGCVAAETGWLPRHLVALAADGTLLACAPLYLKGHSFGEYVFDWGWADAYQRAGGRYYPKLQAAVPFTPVTGRRLLVRADAPPGTADALAAAMIRLAERLGVSSLHITFPTRAEWRRLGGHGFLLGLGHQFHWHNRGYDSFDAFLADLSARKRKAIRKERRAVAAAGIVLRTLRGDAIEERHWDAFYRFYADTCARKWGEAYLNRAFFLRLGAALGDRIVLILAETAGGAVVAGALNVLGDEVLYGRYWGCAEAYKFLHFEACYYQAIAFAIERGLARIEAGAQGPHKLRRGYLAVPTYSAHWIADPPFRRAVDRYLAAERDEEEALIRALAEQSPFRKVDAGRTRSMIG